MNRPTLESGARSGSVPSGSKRSAREELSALRGHIESSDQVKELTIEAEDECLIRLPQPRRRLDERIEHSLQVEGGAADYLEHVGGGGLLLQRLAQLIEQARVFDGDDCLVSEVLDQLDLLIGERPDLLTVNGNNAVQLVVFEHRHQQHATHTSQTSEGAARRAVAIGSLFTGVGDLDHLQPVAHTLERIVLRDVAHYGIATL